MVLALLILAIHILFSNNNLSYIASVGFMSESQINLESRRALAVSQNSMCYLFRQLCH